LVFFIMRHIKKWNLLNSFLDAYGRFRFFPIFNIEDNYSLEDFRMPYIPSFEF
jgi:hypothetical protein